ncbi:MAG TPA: hypothetical protein VHY10_08745, partial [Xanthobacteraceae bacterium]|nr:hypothetical protein [Xanthobacteraceae bacterium]
MDQLLRAAEEALRGIARGYSADLPPIDAIAPHLDGNTVELTLADGQQFRLMLRGRDNLLPPERVGFDAALLAMWDRLRATGNFSVSRQVQRQRWQDEVRADPEIGGPNHRRAMDRIHGLIGNYTNGAERHDLLGLFSETGVGDNPTFLRFLHRVATERDAERERLHRAMELAVRPPVFGVDRAAREDRSSIWEVRWGPHQPGEIAPEMAAFEVDQHHVPVFRAGEIAAAMTATEVQARQREAEGRLGSIHIKNWQYFCRIANIDTTTAGLAGATPPDLFALMNKARQDLMEEQLEAIRRSMMDAMLYGSAPAPLGAASAREAADRGMALLKSWLSP